MDSLANKNWGYNVLSDRAINFSHILLPYINLRYVASNMDGFQEIRKEKDNSITITMLPNTSMQQAILKLSWFLTSLEESFTNTPTYYYKVSDNMKRFLAEWFLSLEACIGLILTRSELADNFENRDFTLINSSIGGLYIEPYTILFNDTFAKIVHPVTIHNYRTRDKIESEIAKYIKGIMERVGEAETGWEGLALLSYVEYKTKLSKNEIVEAINEKTSFIKNPKNSPIMSI